VATVDQHSRVIGQSRVGGLHMNPLPDDGYGCSFFSNKIDVVLPLPAGAEGSGFDRHQTPAWAKMIDSEPA
jgi:hypothetical protein